MFTGLIGNVGEVLAIAPIGEGRALRIATDYELETLAMGASMSCAGICLTVTEQGQHGNRRWFAAEASGETLEKTTLRTWKTGERINLEHSLRMGDPFGGHLVTGHIDGTARIIAREEEEDCARFTFEAPQDLAPFIAAKGSVALDGTSLTVNEVDGNVFDIMLIPHTLKVTTWDVRRAGDTVNLEIDLIARYLGRLHEMRGGLDRESGS